MMRGCAVGIDPGDRWVGVARASFESSLALPIGTLDRRSGDDAMLSALRSLLGGESITELVVGVPVRPDGREDEQAVRFRRFGESLAASLGATCIAQDERFSSAESQRTRDHAIALADAHADHKARALGRTSAQRRRRARERSHAQAAARILQRWLDARASAESRALADRDR